MAEGDIDLLFNLENRVRNVGLPPSQFNALIPLFEAISNAVHAIEERSSTDSAESGSLTVTVLRAGNDPERNVVGFEIKDNGIGLDDKNWLSFRTSDSPRKYSRGGKGVGRLSWLKAFENAAVNTVYSSGSSLAKRSFDFRLEPEKGAIHGYLTSNDAKGALGTTVRLFPYKTEYEAHCPKRFQTIAGKIIGHFLPNFVASSMPTVVLQDVGDHLVLNDYFVNSIEKSESSRIYLDDSLDGEQYVDIFHMLIDKSMQFTENGYHWLFIAGNDRVVIQEVLDSQLGLKYVGDNQNSVYVGLVSGPLLDSHVNQERTGFTIGLETIKQVHSLSVAEAKKFLAPYINALRAKQIETTKKIIRDNPQFISVRDEISDFVHTELALNKQTPEDIYIELSRRRRRQRMRLVGEIKSLQKSPEDFQAKVENIAKGLNEEKKSLLAEYVVKRKEILEILDSSLAFNDPAKRDYLKEEVVHDLIVPLGASSDDLDYDTHNLWILDDRLAFYTYFKSDKQIRTFAEGSDSRLEPDLAVVFDQALAFEREGKDEPVIIVEFKRPGRDDYDGNSSPVSQVLKYADQLRGSSGFKDKDGRVKKALSPSVRFICFVIADFTPSLISTVRMSPASMRTADGDGFFGYSPEYNASIEVLPYSKLVHDARLRNEAFFRKLGLE